jgi:amino acid transporter
MDMQAVLKAGGLGAVVLIVLSLLGLIPCVGCITFLLSFVVYAGIGVLAAHWMPPPRTAGSGATNGALAAVVAALVAGVIGIVILAIQGAITGGAQLAQVPPDQLQTLAEAGIDPAIFAGPAGGAMAGALCCTFFLFIGAGLGAAGGAIWANSKPN